jgi:ferredoxin
MCEFCKEHGEGKKWYLQAKNYSRELYNEERKQMIKEFFEKYEERAATHFGGLDQMRMADPAAVEAMLPMVVAEQKKNHWGQVVPIEEVEQILDMAANIVRLPCGCRSTLRGLYDARYCFGVTSFKEGWADILEYPDYSTDLERLTAAEAKKAIQKLDRNGLVHTVWAFITPYIGGVCNCTATDCLAMKARLRSGLPVAFPFFKAEHVAVIDLESCSGCRDCVKNCNFGAISYSPSLHKCYINQFQCYGCGICRAVCPKDAITLRDRNAIPALAKEW